MCGICGYTAIGPDTRVDPAHLGPMLEAIRHRGPDQEGRFEASRAMLGSRRLSIIDLDNGRMPITNEDRSAWIVFNGEIYNFAELRTFLLKRGHRFTTATDTEVILHLYEEFGPELAHYLNGIFAIAIWDVKLQRLLLMRDRLGIKPLYYSEIDGQLAFSSELKSLLCHPGVRQRRDIDLVALNEYLSFEYVPSPRTILKDVLRLEPGCRLLADARGVRIDRYWHPDLSRSEARPPVHWRDFSNQLHEQLESCVSQELVSDVPVGVLLSGGLDSSTLAALMVQAYPGTVQSFSIGFEEASFDESQHARAVSEHLGTRHRELLVTGSMAAETVPTIMDHLDEPFADSSFIPTLLLSRFAAEHVKVVLGGDGGDELFAGYPTYKAHRLIEYYERMVPRWVRSNLLPGLIRHLPTSFDNISLDFKIKRFLAGRGVPVQARHHRWLGSFLPEEKETLLQEWVKPALFDTYAAAYRHGKESGVRETLNEILYTDLKMYLEGDILYKTDRASMAASLEVRVPLLNRDLVEFAMQLPNSLKLHRLTSKFLLKKAAAPLLPSSIIQRPKKGFNMPVAHWLNGPLQDLLYQMLSPNELQKHSFFSQNVIDQLLREHRDQKKDHRKLLWTLLMFQLWFSRYMG